MTTVVIGLPPPGVTDPKLMAGWCAGWATKNGRVLKPLTGMQTLDNIAARAVQLDAVVRTEITAGNDVIAFGHSGGGQVISTLLRAWAGKSGLPDPQRIQFITTGNPESNLGYGKNRPFWVPPGNISPAGTPEEPYKVLDVGRRYDGWARWTLSARSLWGMVTDHMNYSMDFDAASPLSRTTRGSVTYLTFP